MVRLEEDREETDRGVDEQGAFPEDHQDAEHCKERDQDLGDHWKAFGVPEPLQDLARPRGPAGLSRPEEAPDVLLRVVPVFNDVLYAKSLLE